MCDLKINDEKYKFCLYFFNFERRKKVMRKINNVRLKMKKLLLM